MKKVIILLSIVFLLSGCTKLSDLSYDEIVINGFDHKVNHLNVDRQGYSYSLKPGLLVSNHDELNDVITGAYYNLYLFVDLDGYYHKSDIETKEASNYYHQTYDIDGKRIELNIDEQLNEKYLIEISYNYAKIEVMVDELNINEALFDAVSVISSIKYNDKIIENLVGQSVLNFSEEKYNIFETSDKDKNVLQLFTEEVEEDEIPDTDLVN